jgi:RHS repeat-associated protein
LKKNEQLKKKTCNFLPRNKKVGALRLHKAQNFTSAKDAKGLYVSWRKSCASDYHNDSYRYGFNGQEKDSELKGTGNSVNMGARILDTRLGKTLSLDPKMGLYPSISPYAFALNTPIQAIDSDGKVVIFINRNHYGDGGSASYWRKTEIKTVTRYYQSGGRYDFMYPLLKNLSWKEKIKSEYAFDKNVMKALGDNKAIYRDEAIGGFAPMNSASNADPAERRRGGYAQGIVDAKDIMANLQRDVNGNVTETVKIISHSMGGAYAKGYAQALLDYAHKNKIKGFKTELEADFSPFQPDKQKAIQDPDMGKTYQFSHSKDVVAGDKPIEGTEKQDTSNDPGQGHSIFDYKGEETKVGELKDKKP